MTQRTDQPGPCFVYAIIVIILAVAFAGFGLACAQNPELRAGAINTCGAVFLILACVGIAVAVMTGRK